MHNESGDDELVRVRRDNSDRGSSSIVWQGAADLPLELWWLDWQTCLSLCSDGDLRNYSSIAVLNDFSFS